jgi:Arginase family
MDVLAAKSMIESSTSCDFDEYIKTYSGIATFFRAKHTRDLAETDIALVGLPMDAGLAQRTGARHGPREVRSQSCNVLYFNPLTNISPLSLCRVRDIGDVPIPSAFDLRRMIDEIFAFNQRLDAANVVPITVGGDHSITFPILKALASRRRSGSCISTPTSTPQKPSPARRCTTAPRSGMACRRGCSTPSAPSISDCAILTRSSKDRLPMRPG